jgi:hypothetical protein
MKQDKLFNDECNEKGCFFPAMQWLDHLLVDWSFANIMN